MLNSIFRIDNESDMKLPNYDNKPSGTPLYRDNSDQSLWEDISFPIMALCLPIIFIGCVVALIYRIFN
tara:strand:- start:11402 stop:11605 length:204 start_codon:yes stop_codon:yes gene_type:complete